MPEKKMDKKKLDAFKKRLLSIKGDILHDIKNMNFVNSADGKESSEDNAGHAMHMADVATDMYDREFMLGLASNDRELLNKIEQALKRIDDNSYGKCSKCTKSIPVARLKAIPYTETCLVCQEALEKEL